MIIWKDLSAENVAYKTTISTDYGVVMMDQRAHKHEDAHKSDIDPRNIWKTFTFNQFGKQLRTFASFTLLEFDPNPSDEKRCPNNID